MRRAIDEAELIAFENECKLHDKEFKAPPKRLNVKKDDSKYFDGKAAELQARMRKRYEQDQFKKRVTESGK